MLRELHWLPVSQRIIFKLLTLIYQAVHGQAPVYLCELAVRYRPGSALRSADDPTLLAEPRTRGKYGDRGFAVAGPSLWNDLPRSMREAESVHSFKRQLKTLLFGAPHMDSNMDFFLSRLDAWNFYLKHEQRYWHLTCPLFNNAILLFRPAFASPVQGSEWFAR